MQSPSLRPPHRPAEAYWAAWTSLATWRPHQRAAQTHALASLDNVKEQNGSFTEDHTTAVWFASPGRLVGLEALPSAALETKLFPSLEGTIV